MKTFGWLAVVAALGLVLASTRAGDNLKGLTGQGLQGQYRILSGEDGGKPIPEDHIKDSTVTFTPERVIVFDRDRKQTYAAKYTLAKGKPPVTIHMVSTLPKAGMKADGLIDRVGDDVTLIYALPGGTMPTEFKTKEKQLMLKMRLLQADKK